MSQVLTIKLSKFDNQPWGFRLQGGKDFGTPLSVQKVNGGSLAEQAGLHAGDNILKINGQEVFNLRHKEAQDVLVKAGNNFELTVTRGGIWKPQVTPLAAPVQQSNGETLITKTSLAATTQEVRTVSAHNSVTKPFAAAPAAKVNGAPEIKAVNKQFNSPIGLYSEESIAETLSAQAEVLAQGVLGVNFKKNEKTFDASNSEVFKMVQDLDKHPKEPEPAPVGTQEVRPLSAASGLRHVEPPKPKPESAANAPSNAAAQGPHVRCSECDRLVVGVFVRIKDKNLHVECFKCTICGTSLKNVGYYNINSKLYCDIHARQVARHGPPAPNMEPITVQPDAPIPTGAVSADVAQKFAAPVAAAPVAPAPAPAPLAPFPKPLLAGPTPFSPIKAPAAHPVVFGGVNPPPAGGVSVFPPATSRTSQPGAGLGLKGVSKFDECASTEVTSVLTESSSSVTRQVEVQESVQSYSSSSVTTSEQFQEVAAAPAPAPAPSAAPSHSFSPLAKLGGNVANRPGGLLPGGLPGLSLHAGGAPGAPVSSGATVGTHSAPRRGRGILNKQVGPGVRIPVCASVSCGAQIRGPFVTALGRTWCPEHFVCHNTQCRRHLQDVGFVEEKNELYCESCFENFLAPVCGRCQKRIKGDCLNAIGKQFHPECFACAYCGRLFGNNHFYLEDGLPYCESDWNELFTTKCFACKFPIEAGDRWVEAMNNNYHSQCFNCAICKKNLEGQSFLAKGGRPMCKSHAH